MPKNASLVGKGIIVTGDVEKGTLLMATKAYAMGVNEGKDGEEELLIGINMISGVVNRGTQVSFWDILNRKLFRNFLYSEFGIF